MTISSVSPGQFFASRINEAADQLGYKIEPMSGLYVSDLLSSYVCQPLGNTPLGVDLLQAATDLPGLRLKRFKGVGDQSLMIAGAFPEQLRRRPVKISYYVRIGRAGYNNAAIVFRDHFHDIHFQTLFEDLEQNFEQLRDIVEKVVRAGWPR